MKLYRATDTLDGEDSLFLVCEDTAQMAVVRTETNTGKCILSGTRNTPHFFIFETLDNTRMVNPVFIRDVEED